MERSGYENALSQLQPEKPTDASDFLSVTDMTVIYRQSLYGFVSITTLFSFFFHHIRRTCFNHWM
jgi:hypothetical protein